jgi:CubicO group peptidase (beta-lactamase class C family)
LAGALAARASRADVLLGGEPGTPPDLTARLATIEAALEEQRKAIGIHGAALAIVKDDRVIFSKGFGVRSEGGAPVTQDTLFCIGSDTKAFTVVAAVMSADDGLLSLDDPPRKCLPYSSCAIRTPTPGSPSVTCWTTAQA